MEFNRVKYQYLKFCATEPRTFLLIMYKQMYELIVGWFGTKTNKTILLGGSAKITAEFL